MELLEDVTGPSVVLGPVEVDTLGSPLVSGELVVELE